MSDISRNLNFLRLAISREIRTNLLWPFYYDRKNNINQSVFLAGSGRSGTTWVSNLINADNDYRYLFEPFRKDIVKSYSSHFEIPYIRHESNDKKLYDFTRSVLTGNIRNKWTDRFNSKLMCDKRLIKDIRVNLMLKWIKANFSDLPIVLLLRHPCAVANSKMKLHWNNKVELFLSQEKLVQDFLKPFERDIRRSTGEFEKFVIEWCIENYIPIKQFEYGEIHIVFYENLCAFPEREVAGLYTFLGKTLKQSVFEKMKKPSILTRRKSPIMMKADLINSYKKDIPKEGLQKAGEILKVFGLEDLYNQDSMPQIDSLKKLMKS